MSTAILVPRAAHGNASQILPLPSEIDVSADIQNAINRRVKRQGDENQVPRLKALCLARVIQSRGYCMANDPNLSLALNSLSEAELRELSPAWFSNVPNGVFKGISGWIYKSMLLAQWLGLSGAQISWISMQAPASSEGEAPLPPPFEQIPVEYIAHMLPHQIRGLTAEQLRNLVSRVNVLHLWRPDQLEALSMQQRQVVGEPAFQVALTESGAVASFNLRSLLALTPGMVASQDENFFNRLTPDQWNSFPANLIPSMRLEVVSRLYPSTVVNMPPAVIRQLTTAQISVLGIQFYRALSPRQWEAITPTQITAIPGAVIVQFGSNELANLGPTHIPSLEVIHLPQEFYNYMRPEQLRAFTAAQRIVIPKEVLEDIDDRIMIASLGPDGVRSLIPEDISSRDANWFNSLDLVALLQFRPDQIAAISASAMNGLNGFTRHHLLFSTMNRRQPGIIFVSHSTFTSLDTRFWRSLPPNNFQYFSIEQMRSMDPEMAGWISAEALHEYLNSQLNRNRGGDSADFRISSLPPLLIRNLSLSVINEKIFRALTWKQKGFLTAEQIIRIGVRILQNARFQTGHVGPNVDSWAFFIFVDRAEIHRLPREYWQALGYNRISYHLLSPAQQAWASEDAPAIYQQGKRDLRTVEQLCNDTLEMTLERLLALSSSNIWEMLPLATIRALPLHIISNERFWWHIQKFRVFSNAGWLHLLRCLSSEQWRVIPESLIREILHDSYEFSGSIISQIPPVVFRSSEAYQVEHWTWPAIAALSAEQVAQFPPEILSAFRYAQMMALSPSALRQLRPEQADAMTLPSPILPLDPVRFQRAIEALSADQLNEIPTSSLTLQFLVGLTPNQRRELRPDRIAEIPSAIIAQLPPEVWANFLGLVRDRDGNIGFPRGGRISPADLARFQSVVGALTPAQVASLRMEESGLLFLGQFFLECSLEAFSAIPAEIFAQRSEDFFRTRIPDERIAAITPEQVRWIRPSAFAALGNRLSLLRPEVFGQVRPEQLAALNGPNIRVLTAAQLQATPVETFRGLGAEGATRFYSELSEEQRESLPEETKEFFSDVLQGISIENAGRKPGPQPPPPGGGSGSQGGNRPGDSGGGGGGASGGGARPKDPKWVARMKKFLSKSSSRNTDDLGPVPIPIRMKPRYNDIDNPETSRYRYILPPYQEQVQSMPSAFYRYALEVSDIRRLNPEFWKASQAKQLAAMSEEQQNAIPGKWIQISTESPASKFNSKIGSGPFTYAEYRDKVRSLSRVEIQNTLSEEEIAQLAQDSKSNFLFMLKGDQLPDNPAKIKAMGADVMRLWDATHLNAMSPRQLIGILPEVVKDLPPKEVAKLQKKFFDGSTYESSEDKQTYRKRIQALTKEHLETLDASDLAQLKPEFFEALTLEQTRMLDRKTLLGIQKTVLEQLSPNFFDNLSTAQMKSLFWSKEAVPIITKKFFVVKSMEDIGIKGAFLEDLEEQQIQSIPVSDIQNLSGSLFSRKLLSKLSQKQVEGLSEEQLDLISEEFRYVDGKFIAYLSASQVSQLKARHIIALGDRIGLLGNKIPNLNPDLFKNKDVVGVLFNGLPAEGLYLLKKEQLGQIDFAKMPANAFGKACGKGGVKFLRQFTTTQINQWNGTQRGSIPLEVYGQLIWEIYEKKSDAQIAEDAVGMTPAEFREALVDYIFGLKIRKGAIFTDKEMQKIIRGTFRLGMEKQSGPSIQIVIPAGSSGAYFDQVILPASQVPTPDRSRVPGASSQHIELRA